MNFDAALESYLNYLRIERSLSPHSVSAYRNDLHRFQKHVQKSVEAITEADIVAYEAELRGRNFAQSSIARNLSSIRSFFKYLAREFDIADPSANIQTGSAMRRLPKALTITEITDLINATESTSRPITLRDRALVELLYGTGARVSEVVGINLTDFSTMDSDGQEVRLLKLRGKGSKERMVPVGSFASKAIDGYLTRIRPLLIEKSGRNSSALFLNQRGSRLSRQSAWSIVTNAAEKVNLTGKISPHVFRHSYATHLLDGGADIRVVQELLGHSSVTTTQIYTLITIDKVRESYMTAHPRSR